MPRLVWSPPALLDVQSLYRFLAGKNADAAARAAKTIRQNVTLIALQPGIGRPVADMQPHFKEWLINFSDSGCIALYRYEHQTAAILAVRHQKEVGF